MAITDIPKDLCVARYVEFTDENKVLLFECNAWNQTIKLFSAAPEELDLTAEHVQMARENTAEYSAFRQVNVWRHPDYVWAGVTSDLQAPVWQPRPS